MDETVFSNIYKNSIGIDFILIPAGQFEMGSVKYESNWYQNEKPAHRVKIDRCFYLGKFPVTQKQWIKLMDRNPSKFIGDNNPVDRISWNDAQEFIQKLNEQECTDKYRLPSEAEWEYACRAGTTTRYSFGDNESELEEYCYYGNQDIGSHPVDEKKLNPWGLYDMHGNVWEWTQDIYYDSYQGAPSNGNAREEVNDRVMRVLRGGSWQTSAVGCRSASRYYLPPFARRNSSRVGLRLIREL